MGDRPTRRRQTKPSLKLEGHAFLRSDDGADIRELVNQLRVAVDASISRCEVTGVGTGLTAVIESASPHVRRFIRDLDAAARSTLRHRAREPYIKERQVGRSARKPRTSPEDQVPCPACDGARWPDCPLCGGSGVVSRRTAKAYTAENG